MKSLPQGMTVYLYKEIDNANIYFTMFAGREKHIADFVYIKTYLIPFIMAILSQVL